MIDTKLTQEFEKLFSNEEYGFGRQGIKLIIDYGKVTIEEYDPYIDHTELVQEIEDLEEQVQNLEYELDESEYE